MGSWGPFSLEGKIALVTGATGGIGAGIARRMQEAGARVVTVARNPAACASLERELPGIAVVAGDLGAATGHDTMVAQAEQLLGPLDILVNNAALFPSRPLLRMDTAYLDELYAVNVRGLTLLCKAFTASCVSRNARGKIVNISSVESFHSLVPEGLSYYGATKGAVNALTATLARELGPRGIHVNCIAPGMIVHARLMAQASKTGMSIEALEASGAELLARSHVGRLGAPEDIANAVVFLASAASDFISGQTLVVDGGVSLS